MLKKRYFKTKDEVEVTFELERSDADSVELMCEVNDWQPVAMKRTKDGPFRTKLRLPKDGRYQYRYRIDGDTWVSDPDADGSIPNQFGSTNSVVDTSVTA